MGKWHEERSRGQEGHPTGACGWWEGVPMSLSQQRDTTGRDLNQNKYPLPPHCMSPAHCLLRIHALKDCRFRQQRYVPCTPNCYFFICEKHSVKTYHQKKTFYLPPQSHLTTPKYFRMAWTERNRNQKIEEYKLNYPSHNIPGFDLPSLDVRLNSFEVSTFCKVSQTQTTQAGLNCFSCHMSC